MPTAQSDGPQFLSVTDFHRATELQRQAIRGAFVRGEIAGIQLGKRAKIYIKAAEVARLLREPRQ